MYSKVIQGWDISKVVRIGTDIVKFTSSFSKLVSPPDVWIHTNYLRLLNHLATFLVHFNLFNISKYLNIDSIFELSLVKSQHNLSM